MAIFGFFKAQFWIAWEKYCCLLIGWYHKPWYDFLQLTNGCQDNNSPYLFLVCFATWKGNQFNFDVTYILYIIYTSVNCDSWSKFCILMKYIYKKLFAHLCQLQLCVKKLLFFIQHSWVMHCCLWSDHICSNELLRALQSYC